MHTSPPLLFQTPDERRARLAEIATEIDRIQARREAAFRALRECADELIGAIAKTQAALAQVAV